MSAEEQNGTYTHTDRGTNVYSFDRGDSIDSPIGYITAIVVVLIVTWMMFTISSVTVSSLSSAGLSSWSIWLFEGLPYLFVALSGFMILAPIIIVLKDMNIRWKVLSYVAISIFLILSTVTLTFIGLSTNNSLTSDMASGIIQINQAVLVTASVVILIYSVSQKLRDAKKEMPIYILVPLVVALIGMQLITFYPQGWKYVVYMTDFSVISMYLVITKLLSDFNKER